MATDFFERQASARRNTGTLILLFALAVAGIVGVTSLVVVAVIEAHRSSAPQFAQQPYPWQAVAAGAVGALLLVVGGTLYKVVELRSGGGQAVAERLGGRRLYPDSKGAGERRLLNVVEEMALASGVPTPPVYLLDEEGINAFAAGYSPSDAVLGVTRGAVDSLSRDELQGVIAHEFSHVLNGDMRMSIRLIGILHGILLLGLVGQGLFRVVAHSGMGSSRSSRDKGSGGVVLAILGVAVALVIIGYLGTFLGGLIKAAVSRQREYLADAAAVQFTRNPGGIAGALKRIGAAVFGSKIAHPNAAEASHMYFATGLWEGFTDLTATHPPLKKRILAIEPQWDGVFPRAVEAAVGAATGGARGPELQGAAAGFAGAGDAPRAPRSEDRIDPRAIDHAAEHIGEPTTAHRQYARTLVATLPPDVLAAAREPYGARALVYALLLDRSDEVRGAQTALLRKQAEPDVTALVEKLLPQVDRVDEASRLPLVDLTLPALRALSPAQYKQFNALFWELVKADQRLALFEWTLAQVLARHLRPQFERVRSPATRYYGLQRLGRQASVLLSTLAYAGREGNDELARPAFAAAAALLPEVKIELLPPDAAGLTALRQALEDLTFVVEKHRGRVVDACAECIRYDGRVNLREAELLRGVSDLLDCPMPPLLAGQRFET